jgi:hypothetical protein
MALFHDVGRFLCLHAGFPGVSYNGFRPLTMPCAICETRKEKRFCPAVHGRICAICCGIEREVTLDCPSDCVFLQQARAHERPRSAEELAAVQAELFPHIEVPQAFIYEREPLIVGLSFGIARVARGDREVRDRDAIAALTAMAKAYERLVESGLQYESSAPGMAQQALVNELHKMVNEYRQLEQQHLGYVTLRDSDVLRALVFLVRMAHSRTSGRPRSRAFLDFLFLQFPEKPTSPLAAPEDTGNRIIVP